MEAHIHNIQVVYIYIYIYLFPKQFTVRGSQCFKEWSPWCWMVWSGSRPACLPLPHLSPSSFHLFPRLGAGLSPTSFHLFPTSFHLSPTSFQLSPVLFICLSGWVLVVGFPAGLSPTSFHLSPTSFHLSPTSFHSPNRFTCEGFLLLLKGCMLGPDDFEFVSGLVFLAA